LGLLKNLKKNKPDMTICICGCMMQQPDEVNRVKSTYRHVDLVFGTHNLYKFPELLYDVIQKNQPIIDIWDIDGVITEGLPIQRKDSLKAWVSIMFGCNNFCSYCVVPFVRGRERSRSIEDIMKEINGLANEGYKEIGLLGQNVNSYGIDLGMENAFPKLLREVNNVEGIERIRFMTSHPKDMTDELILAMAECDKVCEQLHLPIQAGSTKVLSDMNRKYTKQQYLDLIDKVKKAIPNIAISTDIIVGFPGETDQDFEDTIDVLEKVRYDFVYSFIYSKRNNTPAAKREDQVSETDKKKRFEKLLEVQNKISKEINDQYMGKSCEVLVEGMSKNDESVYTGRTGTNKVVNFSCRENHIGKLVNVKITKAQTWSLEGVCEE
jgi:tRNA-2-methylthio-N6-dimethylallyladenosine synthase